MIRIQTFGGFSVRGDDGQPLTGSASQPRRMAILAVLASADDRPVSRDRLLSLLWPDVEEDRARNNLAQALYALRRDLGEDSIVGTKDVRLDPERVVSDVAEFRSAIKRGDNARAAALYAGPFLDGFHVPSAADLSRWVDDERSALAHEYARLLEALARSAASAGDHAEAVRSWRKLAATDPLNSRIAIALMEALGASGDPAGALYHARIYETLLEQELDLPPDREVVALANRMRASASAAPAVSLASAANGPPPPVASPSAPAHPIASAADHQLSSDPVAADTLPRRGARESAAGQSSRAEPARRIHRLATTFALGIIALAVVASAVYAVRSARNDRARRAVPIVAIGTIAGFELGERSGELTAPLADLLATNLARVAGLRVISTGRMLELTDRSNGDTSARAVSGAVSAAARVAGASEIVDGTLYGRADGTLRLDLRRVDVATGAILDARTVEGADLFALVDTGTAQLAAQVGGRAPAGSVADVTTRSLAAYGLYVEGLRRYYALDLAGADRLFGAALREDSTFAMATYYWALTTPDAEMAAARMGRALHLASSASERERLTIRAGWAFRFSSPELGAIAETLATRYPDEVAGHAYRGTALIRADEFATAVPYLRHAIQMDSVAPIDASRRARASVCVGCDARTSLIFAYEAMDSLPAAEREARAWARAAPWTAAAWLALGRVLDARGRTAEARAAVDSAHAAEGGASTTAQDALAIHWINAGDYARAEELERSRTVAGAPSDRAEAFWYLAIAYREQGRIREALTAARGHRTAATPFDPARGPGAAPGSALLEAIMLNELGRHREAAALFDSSSRGRPPSLAPSHYARNRAWGLTHAADALAAAGDTSALRVVADTVAWYGTRSGLARDQRLFHHVRGLALAVAGNDAAAVEEFRRSIRSPTVGYTRSNADLARALLRLARPMEAVATLQPTLRGGVEGMNLYVSRTELHELLGQAWDAAGRPDSAAVHWAAVARAWGRGDPEYRVRAVRAAARAGAIDPR